MDIFHEKVTFQGLSNYFFLFSGFRCFSIFFAVTFESPQIIFESCSFLSLWHFFLESIFASFLNRLTSFWMLISIRKNSPMFPLLAVLPWCFLSCFFLLFFVFPVALFCCFVLLLRFVTSFLYFVSLFVSLLRFVALCHCFISLLRFVASFRCFVSLLRFSLPFVSSFLTDQHT